MCSMSTDHVVLHFVPVLGWPEFSAVVYFRELLLTYTSHVK